MRFFYTIASPAAIFGGVVAAVGATALLVRDAFVTGWTIDHALAPALVGLTILCGHLLGECLRRRQFVFAVGLAFLAIFGSGLTVFEAMGRRAEVRDVKTAAADDTEKQRKEIQRKLREAEDILARHRALMASECATGRGKRCDGTTYTVETWEHAIVGYETKLKQLGPPKPIDPKAERVAAVLGFFTQFREADVKQAVALLEPFALPLFLELGSIVLFSLGIGHARRKPIAAAAPAEQVTPAAAPEEPPSPKGGGTTKVDAERDLVTLLALGRPIESQDWLAERWGVGKGTVSKWMVDWESRGIVTRAQAGRCKQIEAA